MADLRTLGATSNRVRFTLKDKTTGQGKTGLSISTTGLLIATIADNEAAATAYTVAGSTIETIATLGTFATPTATKCRFKEVDATNHKGLYEFQFADARFAVTNAKRLVISVNDAEATILDADYEIEFTNDLTASIWDEVNTGATHNIANSTGRQLRTLTTGANEAIYPLSGTVNLTAATSTTATLDALASNGAQAYQWAVLNILTGTGAGQSRMITNYTTGRVATVTPAFTTTPDATSTFDITPTASVQVVSYVAGQDPATLVWAAATRTLTTTIPTAAQIATAVWTDTTAGDFTILTSPGKVIFSQLGGAFTTTSSSVFSSAALANAPTGGTAPTAAAVATAVWQDTTAGDFTVLGSIGKSLFTAGVVPGASGGLFIAGTNAATTVTTSFSTTFTGNLTGNVSGNVTGTIGGLTAAALAMFFTVDTTKVFGDAIAGSVVKETATGTGSDPWAVALPGSYIAGTAGYIIGNRLDVTVSSRSTYAGTDTPGTATLLSRIGSAITINGGAVAIDWAHVVNPTSTVALSNTTISSSQSVATVTGNVDGTIGSFTAAALAQFFTLNTTKTITDAVSGSVVHEIASNSSGGGGGGITAADVWSYGTRTLTSLGSTAPAGWIDAASIVDGALDGKGDWSTYAGTDTPGTTTLLARVGGTITVTGGAVNLNLSQAVPVSNTAQTVGDALNAARVQGFGRWVVDPTAKTLTLYAADSTTVIKTFNLDSGTAPLSRS
jgi:hypothetical protein